MAPFKLFRMKDSSSRSVSQETEPDQPPPPLPSNLVVTSSLNKLTTAITSSSSAHTYLHIDESDQTSENSSIMSLNNDQRALLSAGSTVDQIGYSSPQLSDIPISPPPTYESVMKENQLLALDKENNAIQIHTNLVESFYETPIGSNNNLYSSSSIMASPARESLLIDNDSHCGSGQCNRSSCNQLCCSLRGSELGVNNNESCGGDYSEERCSLDDENSSGENYNNCSIDEYSNECQNQYHHQDHMDNNQYYTDGGQIAMNYSDIPTQQQQQATPSAKGPEILYKSSKELYKAVAKECGITCKMTDTCRCVDCQSRYFDCEFDQNDNDMRTQDHSDGGLGAGTPMFVNEVLHGTACTIL